MTASTTNHQHLESTANTVAVDSQISFGKAASTFFLIALIGFIMHQLLFKGHILSAPPIYNDDFICYSSTWSNFQWTAARPIVFAVIWLIGLFGPKFVHLTTCLMTVGYFTMSFLFISKWLGLPRIPLPLFLFATIATLSYEHAVQCYHYTCVFAGPITGMLSLIAMFCIYNGLSKEKGWVINYCFALLFSTAALLTREDFLLPLLMFCFYFGFIEKNKEFPAAQKRARTALVSFVIVAAGIFAHQHFVVHSPFISGANAYKTDFNPIHAFNIFCQYITCSTGSKIAFAIQVISLVAGIFFQKRISVVKWLFLQAMIFSLIVPYTFLSTHFFHFYALNWIPWQCASSFIFVFVFENQPKLLQLTSWAMAIILSPLIIWQTSPDRHSLMLWFAEKGNISKHTLATLSENCERINHYKIIAVTGAPPLGPWTFTNGDFLKYKMHFNCRWLMFSDPDDDFYKVNHLFVYPMQFTTVELHKLSELTSYQSLPVLKFAPDGTAVFIEPHSSTL